MGIYKKILIILLMMLFYSCSDNKNNPIESSDIYSGITVTGPESPEPIGTIDPDDWLIPTVIHIPLGPSEYAVRPAYPNPTSRFTSIEYTVPTQDSVYIWIDDRPENKKVIIVSEYQAVGWYSVKIDLLYGSDSIKRKEGIIRLFFSFPNNLNFKTVHGDIEFKY